jgi:hypothetical protein
MKGALKTIKIAFTLLLMKNKMIKAMVSNPFIAKDFSKKNIKRACRPCGSNPFTNSRN